MDDAWDLVVVGAGPAGSAAAIGALQADPGARVLLLDRTSFPRDKACGDGIAPHVFDVLADLGVAADLFADCLPVPALDLLGPRGSRAARTTARPARVIPRRVFDARLLDAARAAGAVLRRHRVRELTRTRGGVLVDGTIHATTLVGADGVNGVVRRSAGLPGQPRGHLAVAVRAYAATDATGRPGSLRQRIVLDPEDWPGYAWHFPTGTGLANVGYGVLLRPGREAPSRTALLAGLRRLLPDVGAVDDLRGALLPLASWRPRQPDGPILLAGDAASLVNPFTGEGIYDAVASGALAGRLGVDRGAHTHPEGVGAAYRTQWRRVAGRHERAVRAVAVVGRSAQLVDAGVAAAARHQGAFDDLVELGLAHGHLTARVASRTVGAGASQGIRASLPWACPAAR